MKLIKLIFFILLTLLMVTPSFASKQNWQNDKIDINIYSKKNTKNNFKGDLLSWQK